MSMNSLLTALFLDGLSTGAIYALIAVGFSLLWWLVDLVHLAHGGVMLVVGYAIFYATQQTGLPLPAAVMIGISVGVLSGLALDRLVYHPMRARGSNEQALLTASLGALIAIEYALTLAFGPEGVAIDAGDLREPLFAGTSVALDRYAAVTFAITLGVFASLAVMLRYTNVGRAMRAVAENEELAHVVGLPTQRVQLVATLIAGALVTPAAVLMLLSNGVTPSESLHVVLVAATIAVIGGRGSIVGALLGGLLVGTAESVVQWQFSAGWRLLVTFGFLYLLLLWRPQGLFGRTR